MSLCGIMPVYGMVLIMPALRGLHVCLFTCIIFEVCLTRCLLRVPCHGELQIHGPERVDDIMSACVPCKRASLLTCLVHLLLRVCVGACVCVGESVIISHRPSVERVWRI